MTPYSIAVLLSGSGSNLQALLDANDVGALDAEVALVLSDRADAYGVQRALKRAIPVACIPLLRIKGGVAERAAARKEWEQRVLAVVNAFAPNLVVLSGFMRVLSETFLQACRAPIINQHPALLPEGGGATVATSTGAHIPALRGARVVAEALRLGLPVTGCTIHRVTPVVDDGPVLATAEVPILPGDDEATLHERIKVEERRLIIEVVAQLSSSFSPNDGTFLA